MSTTGWGQGPWGGQLVAYVTPEGNYIGHLGWGNEPYVEALDPAADHGPKQNSPRPRRKLVQKR